MGKHKYTLCEDEKKELMPALDFLKARNIEVTEQYTPPGSHSKKLFASDGGRLFLRRLTGTFYGLHMDCGKTVKGKLRMENLWVTSDGDVKLKDVELCSASRSNVNNTYKGLSKLLRDSLFRKDLPLEIEQWLKIMEGSEILDAYDSKYLIKCHPSIMADRNKLELLMRIYKHLWPIKAKIRDTYDLLIRDLPYQEDWKKRVKNNDFLYDLYYFEDKDGNITIYEGSDGLMHFLKNCDSHLHQKHFQQVQLNHCSRHGTWQQ